MDRKAIIEKVKKYSNLVTMEKLPVKYVVLYGSYAYGTPRIDSDIDVAVVVNRISNNVLKWETRLFKLSRDIDAKIEPVLIEIRNDKSGFLSEIMKKGKIIYTTGKGLKV